MPEAPKERTTAALREPWVEVAIQEVLIQEEEVNAPLKDASSPPPPPAPTHTEKQRPNPLRKHTPKFQPRNPAPPAEPEKNAREDGENTSSNGENRADSGMADSDEGNSAAGVFGHGTGGQTGDSLSLARGGPVGDGKEREDYTALQQRLQAGAHSCYPLRARRHRFQGTVRLSFCVDTQGMATHTRLLQSSGYPSLDEAALDCVLTKALPLPPLSHGRCFVAPVSFGMSSQPSP